MNPSAYDPDLMHTAIHNLDQATDDLPNDGTGGVHWYQSSRKWGYEPEPVNFKLHYSDKLDELTARLNEVKSELQSLRASLSGILQDVSDVDASSAVIASQIAANRNAGSSTQRTY